MYDLLRLSAAVGFTIAIQARIVARAIRFMNEVELIEIRNVCVRVKKCNLMQVEVMKDTHCNSPQPVVDP